MILHMIKDPFCRILASVSILTFLFFTAAILTAQQELAPSTGDGPITVPSPAPRPDAQGIYALVPGVRSPIVIERAAAIFPPDASADGLPGECVLSLIVQPDGKPEKIEVLRSLGAAFDQAAILAVRQSVFSPGTVNDSPVPVRIQIRTRFVDPSRPAYPRIVTRPGAQQHFGESFGLSRISVDSLPVLIHSQNAEYSAQARAAKFQGVVMVSLIVTEEGLPSEVKIVKGVGMGLDEKAVAAVQKYRFRPAMKDGRPVAFPLHIQVDFHLF
jgi:TonB family protein